MRLEDIKLNEAGYAGSTVYFVKAFDQEDGDISTNAGPFKSEAEAKKFARQMGQRDSEKFKGRVNEDDLPSYFVEELLAIDAFVEIMDRHTEQFAN